MVGEDCGWYMCSIMVTTTCFSVTGGVKFGLPASHLWHQDWVTLDWFGQFTASQPFQCLIISIMYSFAGLRSEFIFHNQRHTPTFESWVVTILAPWPYVFTPRWSMLGLIQDFHSILTLPTSHYKWFCKVEIGMWDLKRSLQRVFQSRLGSKLAWPLSTIHTKIEWV